MATEQRLSEVGPEQAKPGSRLGSEPESDQESGQLFEGGACPDCAAAKVADALMGREAIPAEDNPDDPGAPRRRRLARATLDKWHGEPDEQENAVSNLLFREQRRGIDALEDAVQDVLTEEGVRRAAEGAEDNSAPMDAGRLRIRLMNRYRKHLEAGRDLNGKSRA